MKYLANALRLLQVGSFIFVVQARHFRSTHLAEDGPSIPHRRLQSPAPTPSVATLTPTVASPTTQTPATLSPTDPSLVLISPAPTPQSSRVTLAPVAVSTSTPTRAPVPATPLPTSVPTLKPTSSPTLPLPTQSPTLPLPTLADILLSDVEYSGLRTVLNSADPLFARRLSNSSTTTTIFGPDNVALDLLPKTLTQRWQQPVYQLHFLDFLYYHFTLERLLSNDLTDGRMIPMVNDEMLVVRRFSDGSIGFTNEWAPTNATLAKVVLSDQKASNGVFHEVNGPLLPSSALLDLTSKLSTMNVVSTFYELVVGVGEEDRLRDNELTILAPSNTAFNNLPPETLARLQNPNNEAELRFVLLYHMLGLVLPFEVLESGKYQTQEPGRTLMIDVVDPTAKTVLINNEAAIISLDNLANNGIIHVVDNVIMPPVSEAPTMVPTLTPVALPPPSPNVGESPSTTTTTTTVTSTTGTTGPTTSDATIMLWQAKLLTIMVGGVVCYMLL